MPSGSPTRTLEHGRTAGVHMIPKAFPFTFIPLVSFPATRIACGQPIITGIILSYHVYHVELFVQSHGSFDPQFTVPECVRYVMAFLVGKGSNSIRPTIVVPLIARPRAVRSSRMCWYGQTSVGRCTAVSVASTILCIASTISTRVLIPLLGQVGIRRWVGYDEFHVHIFIQIPQSSQDTHDSIALDHLPSCESVDAYECQ